MSEEIRDISPDTGGTGSDVYDVHDAASLFEEEVTAELDGEQAEVEAPVEDSAETPAEEPALPEYPMPEGWEEAMWQAATPELRGKVDSMVKAHAEAMAAKEKAMQDAAAQHREMTIKANAEMQTSLQIMRGVVEGEFRNIDWQGLAKSDPAMYVDLQTQYQQRMNAIQQMQQKVAEQSAQIARAQAEEAQRAMQSEFAAVLPKVKALMGASFENKAFGRELATYLEKSGVPVEAIGQITKGYELELATKAMLWDKQQAAREAAAAKVASAPAVQAPRGAAPVDGGDRLKQARARLERNPNDVDAIAALFEAM